MLDNNAGQPVAEGLLQRAEPAPDLIRSLEVKQDGTGISPAHQAGHIRLERHRAAELRRRRDRGVFGGDDDAVDQRHAIAAEQLDGRVRGQPAARRGVGEKAGDQPAW